METTEVGASRPAAAASGLRERLGARFDRVAARMLDLVRRPTGEIDATELRRTGHLLARWTSFPRGVRMATAGISAVAAGLAVSGALALAGNELGVAAAAAASAAALVGASGPLGLRMANRLHRLVARHRRYRIAELHSLPDRKAVAVRGVVLARRTAASALEGRAAVWSLTRFRRHRWEANGFFHEAAFDFLIDDGTDEPIWVEVSGGMLLDRFPADRRVQFHSTTLLEIDHPYLTRLRLRDKEVHASEINVVAGDVVEVVGRLLHRLDPTASAELGREPPQRRALRSGMRVPVMVRRIKELDVGLARVRRMLPKGPPDATAGEPPVRRF